MTEGRAGPTEVSAPAKLTLSLEVTGTRGDGYHLLRAEMVTVDLADTLIIEEGRGLTLSSETTQGGAGWWDGSLSAGDDNLVARALAATGRTARVHVIKRIPPGAGLGGGSTDAAAILRWADCTDRNVAVRLGADVPFCLAGGRAMVGGVGEEVEALPFEERQFTLLLVPFGVDTGAVYRVWDGLADRKGRPGQQSEPNQLEAAAMIVEPRLARWRAGFEKLTGRRPLLAGSGSTWFVEAFLEELGLGDRRSVSLDGEEAQLVPVRTIPPLP